MLRIELATQRLRVRHRQQLRDGHRYEVGIGVVAEQVGVSELLRLDEDVPVARTCWPPGTPASPPEPTSACMPAGCRAFRSRPRPATAAAAQTRRSRGIAYVQARPTRRDSPPDPPVSWCRRVPWTWRRSPERSLPCRSRLRPAPAEDETFVRDPGCEISVPRPAVAH